MAAAAFLSGGPAFARPGLFDSAEQIESMTLALAQEARVSRKAGNSAAARAAARHIGNLVTTGLDSDSLEYSEKLQERARFLHDLGFYFPAAQLFRSAHQKLGPKLGETHPYTMACLNSLAASLTALGEVEEAIKLNQTALLNRKRILGGNHPATLTSMTNLGVAYDAAGDIERAEKLFRSALEGQEEKLGDNHSDTRRSIMYLADYLQKQQRWRDAEAMYRRLLKILNGTRGPFDAETLDCLHKLGDNQFALGQLEQAESFYLHAWNRRSETLGSNDPRTIASKTGLASSLEKQGLVREAAELMGVAYDESNSATSEEPVT